MADDGIINKGSKYLLLVNEDKFNTEKWQRFEDPTSGAVPPADAVHFQDFIAIGAAGDSLASNSNEKTYYEDDFTGEKYENDSIFSSDPKINAIAGFDDLRFLLKRFMQETEVDVIPPGATNPISTYLLSGDVRPNVKSLTAYAGVYDNDESSTRGVQIDEVDITFNKEDGVIPVELSCFGSEFVLGELKPQGVIHNLRAPPIEGWNIDSIYIDLSMEANNNWIENTSEWVQIGCDVTEFELDIQNNLDEDTGATICSSFKDIHNLSDFTTLNRFRGKLSPSDNADVTATLTKKQNSAFWKQLSLGGIGVVQPIDDQPYPIKVVLYNINGAVIVIGLPGCSVETDGPSLDIKGDEKITLTQVKPGGFLMNPEGSVLASGNVFAHFYPESFYSTQGIGFAQLVVGPLSHDNFAKSRIIIQRESDGHIVSIYDLPQDKFSDMAGIVKTKLKLYRGNYQLYLRTKIDPNTKLDIGKITITAENTVDNPLCLNGAIFEFAGEFGYIDCTEPTPSGAEVIMSPDPIDVKPEVEIEDVKKDEEDNNEDE